MLADVIAQVDELQSSNPAPVATTKTQSYDDVVERRREHVGIGGVHGAQERIRTGTVDQRAGEPFQRRRYAGSGAAGEIRDAGGDRFPGGGEPGASDRPGLRPDGNAAELRAGGGKRGSERQYEWRRSSAASGASPQITVNVQAMDARSFMDRSNDIALAVRDAMLNLNSINDVVNDL